MGSPNQQLNERTYWGFSSTGGLAVVLLQFWKNCWQWRTTTTSDLHNVLTCVLTVMPQFELLLCLPCLGKIPSEQKDSGRPQTHTVNWTKSHMVQLFKNQILSYFRKIEFCIFNSNKIETGDLYGLYLRNHLKYKVNYFHLLGRV